MTYLYTNSSQSSAVNTGLSTQILIKVNGQAVGAIQTLTATQTRAIKTISEVGTDGVIEKVPSGPVDVKLSVNRMVFQNKGLPESFSRGFVNIHAQRVPFDVFIFDYSRVSQNDLASDFDVDGQQDVITTIYENCWFNNLAITYQTSDYTVAETANMDVEFVHSFMGSNPTSGNVSNGVPLVDDPVERLADTSRRGSLDARGLSSVNDVYGVFLG